MARFGEKRLTIDEFFEATSGSDIRFELVKGVVHPMARATQGHNVIRSNVLTALVQAAKNARFRATSVNTAVQTGPDTIRYPDVVVDSGPSNDEAATASKPAIIVVVSSPSTNAADDSVKLREYQSVKSIDTIIQIDAEAIRVKVHRKLPGGTWTEETIDKLNGGIALSSLATSITVNEIYDTLDVQQT